MGFRFEFSGAIFRIRFCFIPDIDHSEKGRLCVSWLWWHMNLDYETEKTNRW